MKAFFKENGRLLLAALCALIAGLSLGFAFFGRNGSAPAEEVRITGDTLMERVVVFGACSHETRILMDRTAYEGYTREEVQKQFPSASIAEFTAARVTIIQSVDAYCPEHYLLKLQEDGTLAVTHTDTQFFTEEVVAVLRDENDVLSRPGYEALKDGVAFDSLAEIDAYLESLGS